MNEIDPKNPKLHTFLLAIDRDLAAQAKAFKNVGVVVLFVCSAGRADQSPGGGIESRLGARVARAGLQCSDCFPLAPRFSSALPLVSHVH